MALNLPQLPDGFRWKVGKKGIYEKVIIQKKSRIGMWIEWDSGFVFHSVFSDSIQSDVERAAMKLYRENKNKFDFYQASGIYE